VKGQLDSDLATKSMLNHKNTPNQETGISPTVALYGYSLKDYLPRHKFRLEWQEILDARDTAHARRHLCPVKDSRVLQSLTVGDEVQIQNQSRNKPNKWHNTGILTESLPYQQYQVLVDGSQKVSLWNRRFPKKIHPVCRKSPDTGPMLPSKHLSRTIEDQPTPVREPAWERPISVDADNAPRHTSIMTPMPPRSTSRGA